MGLLTAFSWSLIISGQGICLGSKEPSKAFETFGSSCVTPVKRQRMRKCLSVSELSPGEFDKSPDVDDVDQCGRLAVWLWPVYPACTPLWQIEGFWHFSRYVESITYADSIALLVRSPPRAPVFFVETG